jgi:hypothetical protein
MPLYLGESSGARVLLLGGGVISQIGTDYQLQLETWPASPLGPVGDCAFRLINVAIRCVGGYHLTVTPIVDGVDQTAQTFTGGNTGRVEVQAHFHNRGTTIAARLTTTSRPGALEILDVSYSFVPLRETP